MDETPARFVLKLDTAVTMTTNRLFSFAAGSTAIPPHVIRFSEARVSFRMSDVFGTKPIFLLYQPIVNNLLGLLFVSFSNVNSGRGRQSVKIAARNCLRPQANDRCPSLSRRIANASGSPVYSIPGRRVKHATGIDFTTAHKH